MTTVIFITQINVVFVNENITAREHGDLTPNKTWAEK